jgi:hypothetical protein
MLLPALFQSAEFLAVRQPEKDTHTFIYLLGPTVSSNFATEKRDTSPCRPTFTLVCLFEKLQITS